MNLTEKGWDTPTSFSLEVDGITYPIYSNPPNRPSYPWRTKLPRNAKPWPRRPKLVYTKGWAMGISHYIVYIDPNHYFRTTKC